MRPALTTVVTSHGEGRLLRPTLRSVHAALSTVMNDGLDVELLIVCDSATPATEREARRWEADDTLGYSVRVVESQHGESGAARNEGVRSASGDFIALIDGDDLVSREYLRDGVRILSERSTPAVLHPEYVLSFGARSLLWRTESASRHDISYRDLLRHNLWPASAIARREVFLEHPYPVLDPEQGYGPEDWVWNIQTTIAGIDHDIVPDAVFFYRVREGGGVNNRHASSLLPAFDMAALAAALPGQPQSAPEEEKPAGVRSNLAALAHRGYASLLPVARRSTRWLSFEAKHAIYRTVRGTYRLVSGTPRETIKHGTPPAVATAMMAAAETEPAISWTAFNYERLPIWRARDDGYSEILEQVVTGLGTAPGAVVAVPWVGVGGADLVSLNYAKALNASSRFAGRVTFLATFLSERTKRDLVPDDVGFVQIDERWLAFPPHLRQRLLAQALVLARPELIVSVNCFHLTESMSSYGRQVAGGTPVFATLFAFDKIGAGYPVNPITDDSQRSFLDDMRGIITDNTTTARLLDDVLALPPEKVLVHRQPAMDAPPPLALDTAAYADTSFSSANPFRLLWPHRLDEEKRPDVLIALARELRRRSLPVTIEIRGQRVLQNGRDTLMAELSDAGLVYGGPYTGGLAALPTHQFHALLLTSQSEGLPLVLVQSMLLGLPVIASGVGGVPDLIRHGQTGLLTAGPEDIDGFVRATESLMSDVATRRTLIEDGYRFASDRHSWDAFHTDVEATFTAGARVSD